MKVLWVAPNLNHYKVRFLRKLQSSGNLEITVLAGGEASGLGHKTHEDDIRGLAVTRVKAPKSSFAKSPAVYAALWSAISSIRPGALLMHSESKFLPLIVFLYLLKGAFRYKRVSYIAPKGSGSGKPIWRSRSWPMRFSGYPIYTASTGNIV